MNHAKAETKYRRNEKMFLISEMKCWLLVLALCLCDVAGRREATSDCDLDIPCILAVSHRVVASPDRVHSIRVRVVVVWVRLLHRLLLRALWVRRAVSRPDRSAARVEI